MCDKCNEIDATISRYEWIKVHINDLQTVQATNDLIEQLKADKIALHPARPEKDADP